ncbi:hypothetical protein JW992_12215 [candidate division KSB1 bacterium]|nr:hypothetical protein [candidate division KSB1 bacterium]
MMKESVKRDWVFALFLTLMQVSVSIAQISPESARTYSELSFTVGPVVPKVDLRSMVREKIFRESCRELDLSFARRQQAFIDHAWHEWQAGVRQALHDRYGEMRWGADAPPLNVRPVSTHIFDDFVVENVLFESFPGWDVNGSLFLPNPERFPPPWRAIVIPVGHSSKTRRHYQIPAQAFARMGFAAILFDPPGMAGEKQGGNDHFVDGVRTYLTGYSANRYFVMDAIRCIDYLAQRSDIDLSGGVGMTGVSGGGTTTIAATLLDSRIRAAAPACCAVPAAYHPLQDAYSPCAETLAASKYSQGGDQIDLLSAALPTPVLLMAGEKDEVFKIEWGYEIADQVRQAYAMAGVGDRFDFYADPGGHDYTLAMVERFAAWMDRWIPSDRARQLPEWREDDFEMLPDSLLFCYPNLDGNIYSLNAEIAHKLGKSRQQVDLSQAIGKLARLEKRQATIQSRVGVPQQAWVHWVEEVALIPESGIELPATFVYPMADEPSGCLLYFDDRGRWTDLQQQGFLADVVRFLDRQPPWNAVLSVDLRGWGDGTPANGPYEIASWGHRERWIAYVSAAMGDPIFAMRLRDGLAALDYLRSRAEIDPDRIVVGGTGMGGIVALHIAVLEPDLAGVFCRNGLAAFELLAVAPEYRWSPEAFFPGVLQHYDIPDLLAAVDRPAVLVRPLDAMKKPLSPDRVEHLFPALQKPDKQSISADSALVDFIHSRLFRRLD